MNNLDCFFIFDKNKIVPSEYKIIRDDTHYTHKKYQINFLWKQFLPYCPDDHHKYKSQAIENFNGMIWQMYFTLQLKYFFSKILPTKDGYPDTLILNNEQKIWFEITSIKEHDHQNPSSKLLALEKVCLSKNLQLKKRLKKYSELIKDKHLLAINGNIDNIFEVNQLINFYKPASKLLSDYITKSDHVDGIIFFPYSYKLFLKNHLLFKHSMIILDEKSGDDLNFLNIMKYE